MERNHQNDPCRNSFFPVSNFERPLDIRSAITDLANEHKNRFTANRLGKVKALFLCCKKKSPLFSLCCKYYSSFFLVAEMNPLLLRAHNFFIGIFLVLKKMFETEEYSLTNLPL